MKVTTDLNKRQFLSTLGNILGATAASSVLSIAGLNSALAYQRTNDSSFKSGKLFNAKQLVILANICQAIIPKTDTPGAADLDCHGFIDHQLMAVHSKQEQQSATTLIDEIEMLAVKHFRNSYIKLPSNEQQLLLTNIEQGVWANSDLIKRFKGLKYLNAFGYFTSEIGATQVLTYLPVPGGYKGSIPCTDKTKNYSSLAFY